MWVAHFIGLAATVLVIVVGVMSERLPVGPAPSDGVRPAAPPMAMVQPITPIRLAQSQDVAILDVQTLDPDYNVIIDAGNASRCFIISASVENLHISIG